jgi:hypothetical protein
MFIFFSLMSAPPPYDRNADMPGNTNCPATAQAMPISMEKDNA